MIVNDGEAYLAGQLFGLFNGRPDLK